MARATESGSKLTTELPTSGYNASAGMMFQVFVCGSALAASRALATRAAVAADGFPDRRATPLSKYTRSS
jgi:hypothetical protein